jgi:hypothetical protein
LRGRWQVTLPAASSEPTESVADGRQIAGRPGGAAKFLGRNLQKVSKTFALARGLFRSGQERGHVMLRQGREMEEWSILCLRQRMNVLI